MKKFITSKNISLLLINLVPLFGVFFYAWDANSIILFYVAETILIGIIHIVKMTALYVMNSKSPIALNQNRTNTGVKGLGLIPFFIFHFGFFIFVQMMVFGGFTKQNILKVLPNLFTENYKYALGVIFIAQIANLISDLFWDIDSDKKLPEDVFFEPYPRIVVQQFMVIIGGWFTIIGNSMIGYLLVLVLCKTVFDLGLENYNWSNFKKIKS